MNYYISISNKLYKKFFCCLIFAGHKQHAFNKLNEIKYQLKILQFQDPYFIFFISLYKAFTLIYLFPKRFGRIIYGIPLPIKEHKKIMFCIKWVKLVLKLQNRIITITEAVNLIIDTFNNKGLLLKKKYEYENIALKHRYLLKYFK